MENYKKLTILHSNDMHGDFFEETQNQALVWGVSMLSGYIQKVKKEEKNCLYTISGDMLQGSVVDSEFKGISTIDIMNMLNPDVVTLGNHEIDYGLAHLLFLEKIAKFPIINANLYIRTTKTRLFKPYYIKEIDGMKILFIGIITEDALSKTTSDALISTFVNVEEAAREVERICNAYKRIDIDFTILLTHIGYENDLKLAELLDPELGVDVIIGGHSHTLLEQPTKVKDILVTQVGVGTNQIWRFDIIVDTDNNCVESYTWKAIPIVDAYCPRDPKIEKILKGYKDQTDQKYNRILSKMAQDLTHPTRTEETQVSNLIADIFREQLGLDMMCLGTGSLRNELLESIVTLWELREMYPYGGGIYALTLTGEELKEMIHFIFRSRFCGGGEEFFAWSKGVSIIYDWKIKEVKSILYQGQPLQHDKNYVVGIQKFHFDNIEQNLGIHLNQLKSGKSPRLVCTQDFDILEEYFQSHQEITAEIEGRLIFENQE